MLTISVPPDLEQTLDYRAAAYGRHEAVGYLIQFMQVPMAGERGFAEARRTQKDAR